MTDQFCDTPIGLFFNGVYVLLCHSRPLSLRTLFAMIILRVCGALFYFASPSSSLFHSVTVTEFVNGPLLNFFQIFNFFFDGFLFCKTMHCAFVLFLFNFSYQKKGIEAISKAARKKIKQALKISPKKKNFLDSGLFDSSLYF